MCTNPNIDISKQVKIAEIPTSILSTDLFLQDERQCQHWDCDSVLLLWVEIVPIICVPDQSEMRNQANEHPPNNLACKEGMMAKSDSKSA